MRPRPFAEKERKFWGGQGWLVGAARLTPWGTAVTWVLLEFVKKTLQQVEESLGEKAAPDADKSQLDLGEELLSLPD